MLDDIWKRSIFFNIDVFKEKHRYIYMFSICFFSFFKFFQNISYVKNAFENQFPQVKHNKNSYRFPQFLKNINPPEALRNLVTPLATPRSDRPGFFNPNGHTTVCQIRVFLLQFASERQRPYHGLTDWVFFNASGHITVCQTGLI